MGYVTTTRPHPKEPYGVFYTAAGTPGNWHLERVDTNEPGTTPGGSLASTQTTYSYRTGKWDDGVADQHEDALLSSENQADVYQNLATEFSYAPQSDYDNGHEFKTTQRYVIATPFFNHEWSEFDAPYKYTGNLICDPGYTSGTWLSMEGSNPAYYGPKAIGNCLPTNPVVDLTVALAELKREGFPKLGKALYDAVREGKLLKELHGVASEEYLAWEFGFQPLLADYKNACTAGITYHSSLETFVSGAGKLQHRTYSFPVENSTEDLPRTIGHVSPISVSSESFRALLGSGFGSQKEWLTQSKRVWFSGAFTYTVPIGDSLLSEAERISAEANHLAGTRVDADTLWNLAPWSWLSDWHNNIGQNLTNAAAFSQDGLVMQYGYLMTETISDHTVVVGPVSFRGGGSGTFTTIFRLHVKERVKASPFGFALNPSAFTDRQWAILAALGLTHGPKTLR